MTAKIVHHVRVAFGDTDRAGVVHHARYLHYLEQSRVELLRERGLDYRRFEEVDRLMLPVVDVWVRFKRPAVFDDELEVETWVGELTRAKLRFDSRILRAGEALTEARITLCCVSRDSQRIVPMPRSVFDACGATAAR